MNDFDSLIKLLSLSEGEPQQTPSDHCYTILQDHGPDNGWGPAAMALPGWSHLVPVVYTGRDTMTILLLQELAAEMFRKTGKATRLVCFTQRDDVGVWEGENDEEVG